MPLSVIRERRKPTARWLPTDTALAVALTLYEASLGPCGHPMDEAYGEHGDWSAETVNCAACAAVEEYQAGQGDKPTPGEKVYAIQEKDAMKAPGEVEPVFN